MQTTYTHGHGQADSLIIPIPSVLDAEELGAAQRELSAAAFVDGTKTSGWSAREVKKNLQIDHESESWTKLQKIVHDGFVRSAMLQAAVLPSAVTPALFNRYDVGMEYGPHVDAPVMGGMGSAVRTDVAITVFLSDPNTYAGGELIVDSNGIDCAFKLDAGSAIVYPADSLHRVAAVTEGTRFAAVIWVQSQVRDARKRELLWDLQNAKRQIFVREGKSATFDAISKSCANLMRMWAEL